MTYWWGCKGRGGVVGGIILFCFYLQKRDAYCENRCLVSFLFLKMLKKGSEGDEYGSAMSTYNCMKRSRTQSLDYEEMLLLFSSRFFQIQTIPYNRCSVLMLCILKLFVQFRNVTLDSLVLIHRNVDCGILDHQEWLFFYFWGFKGGFLAAACLWIIKQQKVEVMLNFRSWETG